MNRLLAALAVCLVASLLLVAVDGYLSLPASADQAINRLPCKEWDVVVLCHCVYAGETRWELPLEKWWGRNMHRQFMGVGLHSSSLLFQHGDTNIGMRRFSRFS
jgi:hypothetical protein